MPPCASPLRRGDALSQDNRVEAIGKGAARCEGHAHIRLKAGDIDRVDALEALDALCQGRVILGVGTSRIEEQLRYLGASWSARGRLLEAIMVLRELWSDGKANFFRGRYTAFADIACFPKPAQPDGPKVLIGGMTAPSLE